MAISNPQASRLRTSCARSSRTERPEFTSMIGERGVFCDRGMRTLQQQKVQTGCKPSPVQRRSEKGNLKHNNTVAGAPEERRRQSCEHYVLPEEFTLPAAHLIPPKCTSSQMCRSDTYVNCHYPHVVTMCPQVHACTPPPATLLWPLFHSSVIGHTSSHSRKPVDSLPTPSRMVVAERVRASGTRESPYAPLGSALCASCQWLCC